jgi:exopolyphosphatase/guanosine-5'-triphosphate,3'-diphosphate pyrophosphatase
MAKIVPRWEWRTFGTRFGVAETRFAKSTPSAVQESDELYFLGGAGANVKVRDDLMDIKVLREVDQNGLERWEPVMKAAFPLPAADAEKVFASLGLRAPRFARDAYTVDQFTRDLVAPGPASGEGPQTPSPLHRRRLHFGAQRSQGGREGHAHRRHRS